MRTSTWLPGPPPFSPSPLKNEFKCKPEFKAAQGQKALGFPYKLGDLALCGTQRNLRLADRFASLVMGEDPTQAVPWPLHTICFVFVRQ